jgi:uncharacterized protein YraI
MNRITILIVLLSVIATGLFVQPADAQQNATWTTEIFNNPYLTGPAAITRRDNTVAFNWGAGSPGSGVPVDNFSARLGADPYFPGGTYRFYILADDGVNFYFDFRSYINTFQQTRPDQLLRVDIPLAAGTHHIQIDYREVTNNAFLYVSWADTATNPGGPNFPAPAAPVPPGIGGQWTAQYFNNASLSGTPAAVFSENTPTHNWGTNVPFASVFADNFSARWTAIQYLDGSPYQISVRADDGIRVTVNGVYYINEWHGATGQLYTAALNLPAGNHTIVVEYYEATGPASLEFNLSRAYTTPNQPAPVPNNGPSAIVTTPMLNVRNAPDAINSAILTRIAQGQSYAVVGRNAERTWWQLNVNGTIGWVNANYVSVFNVQNVPVTNSGSPVPAPTQPTSYTLQTSGNLNIRVRPGTIYGIVGRIPTGGFAQIVARNASNTWWQVQYGGVVGWVSASYIILPANINYAAVPVLA